MNHWFLVCHCYLLSFNLHTAEGLLIATFSLSKLILSTNNNRVRQRSLAIELLLVTQCK